MSKVQTIELPKSLEQSLKLWFLPELHSNLKDHRRILRKKAIELLKPFGLNSKDEASLNNLELPPTLEHGSLSLSHSPEGSALLYSKEPLLIGVDLELKHRISPQIVERISSTEERNNKPADFDLFTCKEACWKALNKKYELPTISHIETFEWKRKNVSWWNFSAKSSGQQFDGLGFSRSFRQFFLSFYLQDSTFVRKHRQR